MRRGERRSGLGAVLTLALVAASCTQPATSPPDPAIPPSATDNTIGATTTAPTTTAPTTTAPTTTTPTTVVAPPTTTTSPQPAAASSGSCKLTDGSPFDDGDSVELVELGTVDGATISAGVYPRPDYEGSPWSQWGQGIVAQNGRFYSAIGDHLGVDGNSYVYEYDPETNRLTLIGDVLSRVDHVDGTWGYGKVHSQMVLGPCDEVYFSTYWGTSRKLKYSGNYTGDIIFRLDPNRRTLTPLGVPVEFHGQASLASDPTSGLIFGESIDPLTRESDPNGPLFVYDVQSEQVVYTSPSKPHAGFRSVLVDANGNAHYSIGGGRMLMFDATSREVGKSKVELPGNWLRAVTSVRSDGSLFGVTREPETLFEIAADGSTRTLGSALGYTTSLALSPDGSKFYYMPGAHGDSADWGSPLVAVDTDTGEQDVVVELNDLIESRIGYTVGGTYNVAVSPDGGTVYMGVNAGEVGADSAFGEVILLVVDLP